MADHYAVLSIADFSKEKSNMKVYNGAITAVSLPGYLTDLAALETATANLILGVHQDTMWVGDKTQVSAAYPTDPDAQRERKALVVYEGVTTHDVFTLTIPAVRTKTAGGVSLLLAGTDQFDLAAGLVSAWVSAFETLGRSPNNDTENVNVLSIRLVGRNI